jgi:hypothetical protein
MDPYYASSASVEWYTPAYIVEGVIAVMGAIDCDPCSNPAPYNVPATVHYTKADDGLAQTWEGRVFMNPPFGGNSMQHWMAKLRTELALGRCSEAICLVPARTEARWFQQLWQADAMCFTRGRIEFIGGKRSGNVIGTAFGYWGPHVERFTASFCSMGQIIYPNAPYRARAHQLTLLEGVA